MNNKWISEYINEISDTNEDTDLGHTDNEPDMLSSDLSVIARYAAELKDVMDTLSNTNDEIDLPHWWQAKVIKAKDYLIGAKHYLRAELEKNQSNTITSEDYKKKLEERVMELTEKNVPTDSSKWSYYKSQAKKKFDVYPSAYANGWAAKQYKAAGGGWETENKESVDENDSYSIRDDKGRPFLLIVGEAPKDSKGKSEYKKDGFYISPQKGFKGLITAYFKDEKTLKKNIDKKYHNQLGESINEAKSMDMNKRLKVYDKLKKGDEITIKYGSSMSSGREGKFKVTKGKTVVGKEKVERIILQNVANPKGVKYYLYQRNGNVTMAIGDMGATIEDMSESVVSEATEPEVITQLRKIVKNKQNDLIKDTKTGKKVRVDMGSANLIVQVYDALKKQSNKDKFVKSGIAMMGHTAYKLMKKENVSESGIMYKAGVKKYGKEGMTKIQSAAGKGEGHEEIGKIKDKYDKSKNEAVKPLKASASFSEVIEEGEYQGRKVELNKPMQGDVKKFKVYVNNDKGNVVKVNFGQKGMVIKKDNPEARKSFRARMNCDNPGPKWKANYWSCKKW